MEIFINYIRIKEIIQSYEKLLEFLQQKIIHLMLIYLIFHLLNFSFLFAHR